LERLRSDFTDLFFKNNEERFYSNLFRTELYLKDLYEPIKINKLDRYFCEKELPISESWLQTSIFQIRSSESSLENFYLPRWKELLPLLS